MKLTPEQEAVVARDLGPGEVLKVIAFAGTGKTTTLVRYALARPRTRFLYVAFNKSVQLEAAAKFPANVVCRTSHALAFARFGAKHRERLVSGFKANTVMQALELDGYEAAKFTIDTLMNYLVSADARVAKRHIPFACRQYFEALKRPMPDVVGLANRLGRLMCTAENPEIGMVHDGYLKLFQLSRPRLHYDCILLDEAQDITPVTAEVILSQPDTPKILVGDPNQQIYSFRGAQNSMARLKSTETLYLTGSFRFHAKIAAVANLVLKQFKDEKKKLRGLGIAATPTKKRRPENHHSAHQCQGLRRGGGPDQERQNGRVCRGARRVSLQPHSRRLSPLPAPTPPDSRPLYPQLSGLRRNGGLCAGG
ncbi:MAG: UvrD-helicase domain-containing protein [Desulfobacterales bacterium]|nr:UvrD-helicase domain-containing protein [Desulfobacterales bacterium]